MASNKAYYQSGKQRHKVKDKKVDILIRKSGQDSAGNFRDYYVPITPAPVWAYYRQLGGIARTLAFSADIKEDNVFYVGWRREIIDEKPSHVVFRGRAYEVQRVDDYEGYKRDVALYCSTPALNFDFDKVKPYSYGAK